MVNVQSNNLGVGYAAPTSAANAAQGKVDAAVERISSLQASLTSIQQALAAIQQAIAILQAELGALSPPDPSQYYKNEVHYEGDPPRAKTVRVFDSSRFNADMATYQAEVRRLEGEISQKQSELAAKENELAAKQRELDQAKRELASAQAELERALQNDARALAEAQRRYQEQLERVQKMQQEALRAQAEAQRAQDELQRAQDALQRAAAQAANDETDPEAIEASYAASLEAHNEARAAMLSAANALPRVQGGSLLPAASVISARDYLDLVPELSIYESGPQAQDVGLLAVAGSGTTGVMTMEATGQMYRAWQAAGFSLDDMLNAAQAAGGTAAQSFIRIHHLAYLEDTAANGLDPAVFGSDGFSIPPGTEPNNGPNATPAEAAAYFAYMDTSVPEAGPEITSPVFTMLLAEHQNDRTWIADFYQALGADQSAELLSQSAMPSTYQHWDPEQVGEKVDVVRNSLVALQQSGFNQADMDALMGHWSADRDSQAYGGGLFIGGDFNPGLSQLFEGLPAEGEPMQVLYFNSATELALDDASGLDAEIRNDMAASAAYVLSGTSPDVEAHCLDSLHSAGSLSQFVAKAMDAEATVPTLDSVALQEAHPFGVNVDELLEPYNGVAKLMFNLAFADVTDPFVRPPLPVDRLTEIRDVMFMEAVKVYGDDERNWGHDQMLCDALTVIFAKDMQTLMFAMDTENHADFENQTQLDGLRGLFEHALFAAPVSAYDSMLLSELTDVASTMGADLRTLEHVDGVPPGMPEAEFQERYGMPREHGASYLGFLLGITASGLEQAIDSRKADADAAANAIEFVVDIATSFIPGPADDAVGKLLAEIYKQSETALIGEIKEKGLDKVKEELIASSSLPADEALEKLYHDVHGIVGNTGNFHDGWETGLGRTWDLD